MPTRLCRRRSPCLVVALGGGRVPCPLHLVDGDELDQA
jgi:hypothetical protein